MRNYYSIISNILYLFLNKIDEVKNNKLYILIKKINYTTFIERLCI